MIEKLLILPFYNEELRLNINLIEELIKAWDGRLIFVDDGSTDSTYNLLSQFKNSKLSLLKLEKNVGKSEALRKAFEGLRNDSYDGLVFVADCDFSVSIFEIIDFSDSVLKNYKEYSVPEETFVIYSASRLPLSTETRVEVERHKFRDVIGFLIRSYVKLISSCPAKDPQTPIKGYLMNNAFSRIISEKAHTRWFLDIEFLQRARSLNLMVEWHELQLMRWRDVPTKNYSGTLATYVLLDIFKLFKIRF